MIENIRTMTSCQSTFPVDETRGKPNEETGTGPRSSTYRSQRPVPGTAEQAAASTATVVFIIIVIIVLLSEGCEREGRYRD
jgi:hypothetical protein